VPSPMNPPSGCPFHTRCPDAMSMCSKQVPKTIDVGAAGHPHAVACHLYDSD